MRKRLSCPHASPTHPLQQGRDPGEQGHLPVKLLPGAACAVRLTVDHGSPTQRPSWGRKDLIMSDAPVRASRPGSLGRAGWACSWSSLPIFIKGERRFYLPGVSIVWPCGGAQEVLISECVLRADSCHKPFLQHFLDEM